MTDISASAAKKTANYQRLSCPLASDRKMRLSSQKAEVNQTTGHTTESRPNADNPWCLSVISQLINAEISSVESFIIHVERAANRTFLRFQTPIKLQPKT